MLELIRCFFVCGAVAQLGERRVRNAKVGSSILLRSTKNTTRESLGNTTYSKAFFVSTVLILLSLRALT